MTVAPATNARQREDTAMPLRHLFHVILLAAAAGAGCTHGPTAAPAPSDAAPPGDERSLDEIAAAASPSGDLSANAITRALSRGNGSGPGGRIDVPIQFDTGTAAISPVSRRQLAEIGAALTSPALRGARIAINGYTDERGGEAYNQALSERRADAVRKYLTTVLQIPAERLEAHGYGESRPLPGVAQDSEAGRAANRRVELVNLGQMKATTAAAPRPTAAAVLASPPPAAAKRPPAAAVAAPAAPPAAVVPATPAEVPAAQRPQAPAAAIAPGPLGIELGVTYESDQDERVLPPKGGTLHTRSRYRVRFVPARDAYVYVYQFDSAGERKALFPNPALGPATNPVRAGQTYRLPAEAGWLTLAGAKGRTQIITLTAASAITDPDLAAFGEWEASKWSATGDDRAAPMVRPGSSLGRDLVVERLEFEHQ